MILGTNPSRRGTTTSGAFGVLPFFVEKLIEAL